MILFDFEWIDHVINLIIFISLLNISNIILLNLHFIFLAGCFSIPDNLLINHFIYYLIKLSLILFWWVINPKIKVILLILLFTYIYIDCYFRIIGRLWGPNVLFCNLIIEWLSIFKGVLNLDSCSVLWYKLNWIYACCNWFIFDPLFNP